MESSLIIKIDAEIKSFQNQLKRVQDESKNLEKALEKTAKISGLAFAGFTAAIGATVFAYKDSEQATNELTQAMIQQGIYSDRLIEKYQGMAEALQLKTGIDDDDIVKAQARLQSYIGNIEITQELTQAMVDLSTKTGDVMTAADLMGKTIGSNNNALARMGIEVSTTASEQQRLQQVVAGVSEKFYGQAAASAQGLGSLNILKAVTMDLAEAIGKQLAPVVVSATKTIIDFISWVKQHPELTKMAAAALASGVAITGLVFTLATAGIALNSIITIIQVLIPTMSALRAGIWAVAGATGLGLLIAALGTVAVNWQETVNIMTSAWQAFMNNIMPALEGIGKIITSVFASGSMKQAIVDGIEQTKQAMVQGYDDFKAIKAQKEAEQAEEDQAKSQQRAQEKLMSQQENDAMFAAYNTEQKSVETEAEEQFYASQRSRAVQKHTQFLQDREKYGQAYATINQKMNSDEMKGFASATSELTQLTQSRNSTLKTIGKIAAIADITIKTAQSAMNIYAGFSTIPIIGPALGIAGAAAAIAFGAERLAQVNAAQQGGIVPGSGSGDRVPMLLEPGELVVPKQVVPTYREIMGEGSSNQGGSMATIVLELKDSLMDFIEAKMVERQNLNIAIQGA